MQAIVDTTISVRNGSVIVNICMTKIYKTKDGFELAAGGYAFVCTLAIFGISYVFYCGWPLIPLEFWMMLIFGILCWVGMIFYELI